MLHTFADIKFMFAQFAVVMWLLTYVGALFNGLTLLIMGKNSFYFNSLHKCKQYFFSVNTEDLTGVSLLSCSCGVHVFHACGV